MASKPAEPVEGALRAVLCALSCHNHDVTPDLIRGPAVHLRGLQDGSRVKPGMTPSVGLARVAKGG